MSERPSSPDRQVTIGAKTYIMRFSVVALITLQELWKCENEAQVLEKLDKLNLDKVVDLVWVCFRSHHPEIGRDEVLKMLDDNGVAGLEKIARDVVAAARPPKESNRPRPQKAPRKKS